VYSTEERNKNRITEGKTAEAAVSRAALPTRTPLF